MHSLSLQRYATHVLCTMHHGELFVALGTAVEALDFEALTICNPAESHCGLVAHIPSGQQVKQHGFMCTASTACERLSLLQTADGSHYCQSWNAEAAPVSLVVMSIIYWHVHLDSDFILQPGGAECRLSMYDSCCRW